MEPNLKKEEELFSRQIDEKATRRLKALKQDDRSIWFGLGMMGMVGWSVAVPALLGAGAGIWMDKRYPQSFSWALTGLIAGLVTGTVIASYWVRKENKEMHQPNEEDNE